jgi:hypothetical protein
MTERAKELTPEELEHAEGRELPAREVMSLIDTDPTCVFISPDPGILPPEGPDDPPDVFDS